MCKFTDKVLCRKIWGRFTGMNFRILDEISDRPFLVVEACVFAYVILFCCYTLAIEVNNLLVV
jgi:hypothetical protein